jgi:hypothetical protein
MDDDALAMTRRSLHGVAELLIAGPQYRAHGTIRLHVTPDGFGGIVSDLGVDGVDVLHGDRREPISGTPRLLGAALGVTVGGPEGLYHDGSGITPDDPLVVEAGAASTIATWFATGDAALRAVFDGAEPILWPEHFDVAVAVGEMTYGVSPGDAMYPQPYAYVVAPVHIRSGPLWNAPFGAVLMPVDVFDVDAVVAFLRAGRDAAA